MQMFDHVFKYAGFNRVFGHANMWTCDICRSPSHVTMHSSCSRASMGSVCEMRVSIFSCDPVVSSCFVVRAACKQASYCASWCELTS